MVIPKTRGALNEKHRIKESITIEEGSVNHRQIRRLLPALVITIEMIPAHYLRY